MHPAIDAAIQLRNEEKITANQIERIDLKVNPLVLELTGKKTPRQASSAFTMPLPLRWSRARAVKSSSAAAQ